MRTSTQGGLSILCCILIAANVCHACGAGPTISIGPDHVCVQMGEEFDLLAECIAGGPIEEWWWWPHGLYNPWPGGIYPWTESADESHGWGRFLAAGDYAVEATGSNGYDLGSDSTTVWAISLDMDIADSTVKVGGLVEVTLGRMPEEFPGWLQLRNTNYNPLGCIRIWEDQAKTRLFMSENDASCSAAVGDFPTTVWIEGLEAGGSVTLQFQHFCDCSSGVYSDSDSITVVGVDVQLGTTTEQTEENPGLYVNANWDDDDGDGWTDNEVPPTATYTGDKSDSYVYHDTNAPNGDNDFRLLWVETTPHGLGGNIAVTYSGGIALWETTTKKKLVGGQLVSSAVASGAQFPAASTTLLYVEGVTGSSTFRDAQISATYLPCGASDLAKLTVFEVDLTGLFGYGDQQEDNYVRHSQSPFYGSSDKNGMISWDDADASGKKAQTDLKPRTT